MKPVQTQVQNDVCKTERYYVLYTLFQSPSLYNFKRFIDLGVLKQHVFIMITTLFTAHKYTGSVFKSQPYREHNPSEEW